MVFVTDKSITPKRLELKKVYSIYEYPSLKKRLLLSNLRFRKTFPSRQINSLYFDNSEFSAIQDSISGSSERKKTRLRWYGDLEQAIDPVLELKFKKGSLSWKELYSTSLKLKPSADNWLNAFTANENGSDHLNIKNILPPDHTIPISLVSYLRNYFESFDGRIRATIDVNLSYRDQTLQRQPNFKIQRMDSSKVILELKLAKENFNLLRDLTYNLGFTPQRFSKYCESTFHHRVKWR